MTLELTDIARAMGVSELPRPAQISGWSVDSRTLAPGDLFFALRGPNHDGHDYVAAALERGAAAAVVERDVPGARNLLRVSDALRALQMLASAARQAWGGIAVGVTGSAGKTTTKDAIAHLLAVEMAVGKSSGNLNNHVGLPLSILRLPAECRVAVLEMGMNHPGEIRTLCGIARPDIGVVTNVGYAHMQGFDSIEGVARAKRELIESLPEDGVAVLNADDPLVREFRAVHRGPVVTFGLTEGAEVCGEDIRFAAGATRFRVGDVEFQTALPGRPGVMNMLAAIAAAHVFGIAPAKLREAVSSFAPGDMRGQLLEHAGVAVWNDCYNSNPEAARAMLDVLCATPAERRVAVLGEMLELGQAAESLHRDLGRYVADRRIDALIGIRGAARSLVEGARAAGMSEGAAFFFADPEAAGDFARGLVKAGDAMLFKGSRGVHVERALERFLAQP